MSQADTLQRTLNQHAASRTPDYRVWDTAQSVLLEVRAPVPGNPLLSTQTFTLFARPRRALVGSSIHVKLLAPHLQLG
jgi:hypothetical protein